MKCYASVARLLVLCLVAGCGAPSHPREEDVKSFISNALGEKLLVKAVYANQNLANLQGMPNPIFVPPPILMPPDPFLDPSLAGNGHSRSFFSISKRPELLKNRESTDIGATLTNTSLIVTKSESSKVTYSVTATQTLAENLYRLRSAGDLKRAIGWKTDNLTHATSLARRLSGTEMQRLEEQFAQARDSREYVMELVHAQGSTWPLQGEVEATIQNGKWQYEIRKLKPEKLPDLQAVSGACFPAGLMAVDPKNYQASASEWSKPYLDFIANVDRMSQEKEAQLTRRQAKLEDLTQPGHAWSAFIKTPKSGFDITIRFDELTEQVVRRGTLMATVSGSRLEFQVNGFLTTFHEAESRQLGFPVDDEILGPVLLVQPVDPDPLVTPFNEMKCRLTIRAEDDAPTFLWLGQTIPMTKAN